MKAFQPFYNFVVISVITLTVASCQKDQVLPSQIANDSQQQVTTPAMEAKENSSADGISLPEIILVPAGNKLSLKVYAKGVQIWEVRRSATDPSVFNWVNIAPSAVLYRNPDFTDQLGSHYAGPTWEFQKGPFSHRKVVASKLQAVTVDVTAVPWLLLKSVDSLSSPNNKITYIQRISTTGGIAPTTGADESHLGMQVSIPYTASYLFYENKN